MYWQDFWGVAPAYMYSPEGIRPGAACGQGFSGGLTLPACVPVSNTGERDVGPQVIATIPEALRVTAPLVMYPTSKTYRPGPSRFHCIACGGPAQGTSEISYYRQRDA